MGDTSEEHSFLMTYSTDDGYSLFWVHSSTQQLEQCFEWFLCTYKWYKCSKTKTCEKVSHLYKVHNDNWGVF